MKTRNNTHYKFSKYLGICISIFLQFFSLTFANTLIFNDSLFTGSLSGTQNSYSEADFLQSGNNFAGIVFWDTGINLTQTHEVMFNGTSKFCDKQIKGTYYNPRRGTRLRPLDSTSLTDLQTIDTSYNNLDLTGGFFYDCSGESLYQVFGQITHSYKGIDYKIIAGVEFTGNTYTGNFDNSLEFLTPNGFISTGKIFDNYGGVATLQGSGNLDFDAPSINLISPSNTSTQTNNSVNLSRSGSDNFNISGYYYQVAKDNTFTQIISESSLNNTGITLINLVDDTYYRRVSATDFTNHTTWSNTRNFTINASNYVQLPNTTNTGDIQDAFINQDYQTGAGALQTVSNDTLVGYTGIDLNDNGLICPQVPVVFQSSGTRSGNILEMEINNCIVIKTAGGNNYSGILYTPIFTGIENDFELINLNTDTIAQIGPNQSLYFENTGGTSTTVTLRIPTPGITIGDTIQIYSSTDTDNRNFEGTTIATGINGESYAIFATNHLTYFTLGTETGNFVINNDDSTTNTTGVTLNMSVSGATQMRFGNTSSERDNATRQTYASSTGRTLTSGNGDKTVYAEFKNAGGETGIVTDTINYYNDSFSLVFTGNTPNDQTVSNSGGFSATIDSIDTQLSKITRNRDGSAYILDMSGWRKNFSTGYYSLTDYSDTGLILAMNFDNISSLGENSTTVKDLSISNNTGTVYGASISTAGKYNGSFDYDGSNDYIYLMTDNEADTLGNTFTYSTWFKSEATAGNSNARIATRDASDYRCIALDQSSSYPQDLIVYYDTSNSLTRFTGQIKDNQRHQITIVRDYANNNAYTYYDGELLEKKSFDGFGTTTVRPIIIGDNTEETPNPGVSPFDGKIDDVRIYNYALNSDQIKHIYNTTMQQISGTQRKISLNNIDLGEHTYQACATNTGTTSACTSQRTYSKINDKLLIYKTSDKDIYHAGDTINYNISFYNTGETTITGVVIQDTLASGLQYLTSSLHNISSYNFATGTNSSGNTTLERSGFNLSSSAYGSITIQATLTTHFPLLDETYFDLDTGFITPDFRNNNPTSGEIIDKLYATNSPYTQIRENYNSGTCNIGTSDIIEYRSGDTLPTDLTSNKIYLIHTGEYKSASRISIGGCTALIGIGDVEISTTTQQTYTVIINHSNYNIIDHIKIDGEKGHAGNQNQYGIELYQEASNNTINSVEVSNVGYGIRVHLFGVSDHISRYMNNNLINNSISHNNYYGIDIITAYFTTTEGLSRHNIVNNCQTFNNNIGIRIGTYTADAGSSITKQQYNTLNNTQIYNNNAGIYLTTNIYQSSSQGETSYNTLHNLDIYNNGTGLTLWDKSPNGTVSNNNLSNINIYNNSIGIQTINVSTSDNNKYYNTLNLFDNDINFDGNGLTAGGTEYSGSMGRTGGTLLTGHYQMSCDYANIPRNKEGIDLLKYGQNFDCTTRGQITSRKGPVQGIRYGALLTQQTQPVRYSGTTLQYYGTAYIDYFDFLANARISPLEWILNHVTLSGENINTEYVLNSEYQNTVDLRVQKTLTGYYRSGGIITYTINYGNSGYDTDTVTLIDTLSGLRLSGADYNSGNRTYSGNNIFYTGFTLAPNTSGSITLTAIILTGTAELIGTNTVTITGSYYDRNTGNNTSAVQFTTTGEDIILPIVQHLSPSSGTTFNTATVNLVWSGSDNVGISKYYYQIFQRDTNTWTGYLTGITTNTGLTLNNLQRATYQRQIKAEDVAGNQSARHTGWTFDINVCQTSFAWDNNNFITQTGFRENNPNECDIMIALYGTGDGDTTAYTQDWDTGSRDYRCNRASGLTVSYINSGNGNIPENLSGNTVYVLSSGTHILPYTGGINMSGCNAIIGNGTINIYSSGQIQNNNAMFNNTQHKFDILDNININGAGDGAGGIHTNNRYGIDFNYSYNNTFHTINSSKNSDGIRIYASYYNNIYQSNFYNNSNKGIYGYSNPYNKIIDTQTYNNSGYGIECRRSHDSLISGVTAYDNNTAIWFTDNSDNITIQNSEAHDNNSYGIYISYVDTGHVKNVKSYNNGTDGIYIYYDRYGTYKNLISYNNNNGIKIGTNNNQLSFEEILTFNNNNYGIQIYSANNITINTGQSYNNRYGIDSRGDNNNFNNMQIYNNSIKGINIYSSNYNSINNSQIYNNNNEGIYISRGQQGIINNSQIYNNENDGIYYYDSRDWLFNESNIYNNGEYGILFDSTSTGHKYYGTLKMFDNTTANLSGTNGSDNYLTGGGANDTIISGLGRSTGNMSTTGSMSCELYTNPKNDLGIFLMDNCTYIQCEGKGKINWTGTLNTNYLYGSDIFKQTTGYIFLGSSTSSSDDPIDTGKFIAEVNSLGEYDSGYACQLPQVRHISPLSGATLEGTTANLLRSGYSAIGISGYYYTIERWETDHRLNILSGSTIDTGLSLTGLQDTTYKRQIKAEDLSGVQSARHTGWTFEANKYTDIHINKNSDKVTYHKFDTITYTINFSNNGTKTATGVEIFDKLHSGLQYISYSFTGPTSYTFSTGTNSSGDLLIYRTGFDLTAGETGSIVLTAQVVNSFTPTLPGRGYKFDGIDDIIIGPNASKLGFFHTGNFLISFWENGGLNNGYVFSIAKSDHEQTSIRVGINNTTNEIYRKMNYDDGYGNCGGSGSVGSNSYIGKGRNHVSILKSGLNINIYVNGILKDSKLIDGSKLLCTRDDKLVIGRRYSNYNYELFSGEIYDFRIYNEALNNTTINNIKKEKYIGSPIFRYKMDEGTGTIAYDSAGNGYTGAIINANLSTFHFADEELYSFQYNLGRTDGNGSNGANTGVYIPRDESNTGYDVLGNPLDYYQTNQPFCLLGICNYVIADGVYAYNRASYAPTTDLYISKTITGDYNSGGVVKYTITYGNSGYDTATNIEITEAPSQRLSGTNYSPIRTNQGNGTFTTTVSDLTVGATGSIVFTATVISGAVGGITLNNAISITGYYFDMNTGNNNYTTGFETRDTTNPYIYFTGTTPASGTISTNTTFTGEVEALEDHLRKLVRNRDGTEYIFDMTGRGDDFGTGDYSLTDYSDTGLILAMNFDTSGDLQDYSLSGNNGTNSKVIRTGNGIFQGAYDFQNNGGEILFDNNIELDRSGSTISIRLNIRDVDISNYANGDPKSQIIGRNYDLSSYIGVRRNGGIVAEGTNNIAGDFWTLSSLGIFSFNQRHNLTLIANNGIIKTYLDMKLIDTRSTSQNMLINRIGESFVNADGPQYVDGVIDDVRIYNYPLTTGQIAQIYNTTITKYSTGKRGLTTTHTGLPDGTYTYKACAEDQAGNTGCTNTGYRTYTVQTPKIITVKTATPYTTTGNFRLFEQTGTTSRKQIFNSSKITGDIPPQINYGSNYSTGQIIITGQLFPSSGSTYLAVYKLTGALAVGYTGIWIQGMTGFDFSNISNPNLYPILPYQNKNYLYIGDVDASSTGAYDLIYGPDLALQNTKLTKNSLTPLKPIYDFDYNDVATALEQAMILYNLDIGGYLQDHLPGGLELSDFKTF